MNFREKLVASLAAEKHVALERELTGVKRQLAQTVSALARTRSTKPVHFRVGRARAASRGDEINVCIADTHGAKVSKPALAAVLADVQRLNPHRVTLLGDHVDCGGFLAQHHVMGYVAETPYTYEQDIAHAAAFLDQLQAAAPRARIEYLEGNHERRVETWCVTQTLRNGADAEFLRRSFAPEFLLKLHERGIPYYRQGEFHDGLGVNGIIKRGKCFFLHGISTAKHSTAMTLARVYGNVVYGDIHRSQSDIIRRVGTGVVGAWCGGCLCELQPLWNHTKPTDWTHGYGVQLTTRAGNFLHLNIPIIDGGQSLLTSLIR